MLRAGRAIFFTQLEVQNAGQEAQANGISDYNHQVSDKAAVSNPQSDSGRKNQEHP